MKRLLEHCARKGGDAGFVPVQQFPIKQTGEDPVGHEHLDEPSNEGFDLVRGMPGQPRIQLLGAGLEHRGKRGLDQVGLVPEMRSEEHTSELQSLMRISYAVFCLKKKKNTKLQCEKVHD